MEAFSLVTLAPLPWILWRTSFPLPPPSLKAAPCFAETSLSLGARTLLSTNNFRTFSFSDDPWTQRAVFSLMTLAQSSNISQCQNHKLPEKHIASGLMSTYLLLPACLWFSILGNWTWMNPSLHHYTWITLVNFRTSEITYSPYQNWDGPFKTNGSCYLQHLCLFYTRRNQDP